MRIQCILSVQKVYGVYKGEGFDMKRIWRWIGIGAVIYFVALFTVAGMLVGLGHISQPKALKSVTDPFSEMDMAGLPPVTRYKARDGAALSYRLYKGGDAQVAVLIHGSAGSSNDMHRMAEALLQRGVTVYVPDLRGHGANSPHGDIFYLGQLDDDMADFMQAVHPKHKNAQWTLVGFSSGGGFAADRRSRSRQRVRQVHLSVTVLALRCANGPPCLAGREGGS